MTLIISEVSNAGVAMVADSMISYPDAKGNSTYQKRWKKLLKTEAAGMPAGVSYWGNIGDIHPQFDHWLASKLAEAPTSDLFSLASYLAEQVNQAAGNKLIAKKTSAGIHVAGFHPWSDCGSRPTFFHIHNGDISAKATARKGGGVDNASENTVSKEIPTGSRNDPSELQKFLQTAKQEKAEVDYSYDFDTRKHFDVHPDFPKESAPLSANMAELEKGHLTRNGHHLTDALVEVSIGTSAADPHATDPSQSQKVGGRLGALIERMKIVVAKYASHSSKPEVGGPISVLAICPDGTVFEGDDWK